MGGSSSNDPKQAQARRALTRPEDALPWLRAHGLATLTPTSERVPSLVAAVARSPVRGSWWAHPDGSLIYACAEALEASGRVVALKLVGGKVTFVHQRAWPALLRLLGDPARARAGRAALPSAARALYDAVAANGRIRLDRLHAAAAPAPVRALSGKKLEAARHALEQALLVVCRSEHTELGRHATVLQSWEAWAPPALRARAGRLSPQKARAQLEALGVELSDYPRKRKRPDTRSSRNRIKPTS